MRRLTVPTTAREQLVDVTSHVRRVLAESGTTDGAIVVFCPHTTAGVTLNENADPDVVNDVLRGLREVFPLDNPNAAWRHDEGNSDAHIKASLVGSSVTVIVDEGRLALGTWQAIWFAEFDGPRSRELWVKVLG